MGAGSLRERIVFERPKSEPDGHGGIETGWTEMFEVRAALRWLRGGESVQAARLSGRQPAVFTIRANDQTRAIAPDWRLRDLRRLALDAGGQPIRGVFNIRAVIETEDRAWIEITAETGVAT
ncbi:head-tail adaptor protein [Arenibacterium halophilum]|uniref:Head-tail adaptor protein n=1 Tax=Arenibacterium halophilum TaxID=2583821 RepID=A0ABY2WX20_9RHOB|nr:head-tail adaptor protein [Arenibacterium halophilum]